MAKKKNPAGPTPPSQFRFEPSTLAELDRLVIEFAAETGDRETRTSVLRHLIHREFNRRTGGQR